jgi:hypothetical protein
MAIDGTYNITIDTPMGTRPGKLTLKTDAGSLSGSLSAEGNENAFKDGMVSGNNFTFSTQISTPMGQFTLGFKGTVNGDDISGQVQAGDFGSFPFKGNRS